MALPEVGTRHARWGSPRALPMTAETTPTELITQVREWLGNDDPGSTIDTYEWLGNLCDALATAVEAKRVLEEAVDAATAGYRALIGVKGTNATLASLNEAEVGILRLIRLRSAATPSAPDKRESRRLPCVGEVTCQTHPLGPHCTCFYDIRANRPCDLCGLTFAALADADKRG